MARARAPNINKTPSPAVPWPCMQISLPLARAQVPNMNKTPSHGHACKISPTICTRYSNMQCPTLIPMARARAPNIGKTPSPALPWPCMQISLPLARAQAPNMNKTPSHGHACKISPTICTHYSNMQYPTLIPMARARAPNIGKTPSPALLWPCMQISLPLARA